MHLINARTLALESFSRDAPPYAILSHTWLSNPEEEVTQTQFHDEALRATKRGFQKIEWACRQAIQDDLGYAWVDTCCIDKSSSAELSEAINSMFKWYRAARVCYAYLDDVSRAPREEEDAATSEFGMSRWFERGWTLQELIAPASVVFFGAQWTRLGTKSEMLSILRRITGVSEEVLAGGQLDEVPVARRMSWAAKRKTTREEDIAYCLMGIFDVNMPMLYGEGPKAFIRLQEEIMKESDDQSLFAWKASSVSTGDTPYRGIFAESPSEFADSGAVIPFRRYHAGGEIPPTPTSRGVRFTSTLYNGSDALTSGRPTRLLGLNCRGGSDQPGTVCIEITSESGDLHVRSQPSQLLYSTELGEPGTVFIRKSTKATARDLPASSSLQNGIYVLLRDQRFRIVRTNPDGLYYDPGTRTLEAGGLAGEKIEVLLADARRYGFLEIDLWPTPAEGDHPAKCDFRTRWTLSSRLPFLSTSRNPSGSSCLLTPWLGMLSLFSVGCMRSYVEVMVRPIRMEDLDMFCVEVRVLKFESMQRLVSKHLSAMPLSEWFLLAVQVAFLLAFTVTFTTTSDFFSAIILAAFMSTFLLYPAAFILKPHLQGRTRRR